VHSARLCQGRTRLLGYCTDCWRDPGESEERTSGRLHPDLAQRRKFDPPKGSRHDVDVSVCAQYAIDRAARPPGVRPEARGYG